MNEIIPVLLAGGIGSRLWPLSRENYPKQFLNILICPGCKISKHPLVNTTLPFFLHLGSLLINFSRERYLFKVLLS